MKICLELRALSLNPWLSAFSCQLSVKLLGRRTSVISRRPIGQRRKIYDHLHFSCRASVVSDRWPAVGVGNDEFPGPNWPSVAENGRRASICGLASAVVGRTPKSVEPRRETRYPFHCLLRSESARREGTANRIPKQLVRLTLPQGVPTSGAGERQSPRPTSF